MILPEDSERTKLRSILRRIFDLIDVDMSDDLSKEEILRAFTRNAEVRETVR